MPVVLAIAVKCKGTMLVILAYIGVRFALHVSRQSGRALADECYTRKYVFSKYLTDHVALFTWHCPLLLVSTSVITHHSKIKHCILRFRFAVSFHLITIFIYKVQDIFDADCTFFSVALFYLKLLSVVLKDRSRSDKIKNSSFCW